jgi:hypothetical protein
MPRHSYVGEPAVHGETSSNEVFRRIACVRSRMPSAYRRVVRECARPDDARGGWAPLSCQPVTGRGASRVWEASA